MMDSKFIDRLREILKYEDVTRSELEELTGIKKTRWDSIFNRGIEPRVIELEAICKLMPEYKMYLVWGEEEPTVGQVSPHTKKSIDRAVTKLANIKAKESLTDQAYPEDEKDMTEAELVDLALSMLLEDRTTDWIGASKRPHKLRKLIDDGRLEDIKRAARKLKTVKYEESLRQRGKAVVETLKFVAPNIVENIESTEELGSYLTRTSDYIQYLKEVSKSCD